MSELVPISYFHEDILENSSLDELVYLYAERVYKQEDCSSPEDFLEQVIAIEYFPDITFHSLLEEYYEEQGKDIEDEVRGYVPHKSGFLMTHGVNYSWLSADLFGGTADGKAVNQFEDWLKNKGFKLV